MAKKAKHHDLLSGLVPRQVLQLAAKEPTHGDWTIDALARHGYRLPPRTRYSMLAKMARVGYRACRTVRNGRAVRKLHTITDKGREGLAVARLRSRERVSKAGQG